MDLSVVVPLVVSIAALAPPRDIARRETDGAYRARCVRYVRGWATAAVLYKGMPPYLWGPLVSDMVPDISITVHEGPPGPGRGCVIDTSYYTDYGLAITSDKRHRLAEASFRVPAIIPPP
jgi:hypothetical protein